MTKAGADGTGDAPSAVLESALYVGDLDAAEAFYAGVLRLPVIAREAGRHVFLRCGAGVLLLFDPARTEVAAPGQTAGLHGARGPGHLCFRAEPQGVEAWRERLVSTGTAIETEVTWPNGARSVYFRDPAGNSLEIAEARLWGVP